MSKKTEKNRKNTFFRVFCHFWGQKTLKNDTFLTSFFECVLKKRQKLSKRVNNFLTKMAFFSKMTLFEQKKMHFFDHFLDDLFSPLFRTIQNRTICSKFIIHATMSLQNDKNDKNDQNHLKLAKWLKTDQKLIKKSVIFGVFWVPKPQC